MKKRQIKSDGISFPFTALIILCAAAAIITYVGLRQEIEKLKKDINLIEEDIRAKNGINTQLKVDVQKLKTEERIVQAASEKLGMIKNNQEVNFIEIDKIQLEQITKAVNSKYE